MSKSKETFSKKDKEKKREKKKQDKEVKKQERKANSLKGKGLEDMMAYVDENGNITTTPPDPNKRRVVNQEDMVISVAKQAPREPEPAKKGVVAFFNDAKGYGFIRGINSDERYFVHINNLSQPIKEGDKVTFKVEQGPKGLNAVEVKLDI